MAPVFLFLGPARAQWPEPLGGLVARGRVGLEGIGNVHEAAVLLAREGRRVRGLVIDPRVLVRRDVEGLAVLLRHVVLPMVMLPLDEGASPCVKDAEALGAMRWEEAAGAWGALEEWQEDGGRAEACEPEDLRPSTDNPAAITAGNGREKSVTEGGANRYDELKPTPLVSAEEMAALLEELN